MFQSIRQLHNAVRHLRVGVQSYKCQNASMDRGPTTICKACCRSTNHQPVMMAESDNNEKERIVKPPRYTVVLAADRIDTRNIVVIHKFSHSPTPPVSSQSFGIIRDSLGVVCRLEDMTRVCVCWTWPVGASGGVAEASMEIPVGGTQCRIHRHPKPTTIARRTSAKTITAITGPDIGGPQADIGSGREVTFGGLE